MSRFPVLPSRTGKTFPWVGWGFACLLSLSQPRAHAQEEFISRTRPAPTSPSQIPTRYNLKWGDLTARLQFAVQTEFTYNLTLSENSPEADFFIEPRMGIGFLYPISREHVLQLDLEWGYHRYFNHPSVSNFSLSPTTRLEEDFFIHDVRVNLHDWVSIQNDPTNLGVLNGNTPNVAQFNQIQNVSGLLASWQFTRTWDAAAGYDFQVTRSLNGRFTTLDQNGHTWMARTSKQWTPRWNTGLMGSYHLTRYRLDIQNDSSGWRLGPYLRYEPTRFLTLEAGLDWNNTRFRNNGTILDRENFSGWNGHVEIQHTLNRRTNHRATLRRSIGQGFGSNYTELLTLEYGISREIRAGIELHATFLHEILRPSSGFNSDANRNLFTLNSRFRISQD